MPLIYHNCATSLRLGAQMVQRYLIVLENSFLCPAFLLGQRCGYWDRAGIQKVFGWGGGGVSSKDDRLLLEFL